MVDTPRRIKRLLREYAAAAHEEELRRALLPVAEAFNRWAKRELGSGELSEIIHQFHQGPAKALWVRYNTPYLEMAVAYAITSGLLARDTPGRVVGASCRRHAILRGRTGGDIMRLSNIALEQAAGSHSLAAAAQRER